MAAATICSDFGAQKNKVWHCFQLFPHLFPMKWWDRMPWNHHTSKQLLSFLNLSSPLPPSPPLPSSLDICLSNPVWTLSIVTYFVLFFAAAKSCQSCPTLCDPIDGSPPGSSVPGILQARTLEWVANTLIQVSSDLSLNCSFEMAPPSSLPPVSPYI